MASDMMFTSITEEEQFQLLQTNLNEVNEILKKAQLELFKKVTDRVKVEEQLKSLFGE